MKCTAVIGACFGDEGKGLVTDKLCDMYHRCTEEGRSAVIRHNGGAQAGHTVSFKNKRFVFHQTGSGSFRGADTVWAESFLPDIFKLSEECTAFEKLAGFAPRIFSCAETCCTLIDDVLINMAVETSRGDSRHGSCGMGINEADLRIRAGFGIDIARLKAYSAEELFLQMREIRRNYSVMRLEALGLGISEIGEYGEMLGDDGILRSAAEEICRNIGLVSLLDDSSLRGYNSIVFEGAQGLLLDAQNKEYAPHTTASRTGLDEPLAFCKRHGLKLDTAVYVARSYLTRHGAGLLPNECAKEALGNISADRTNVHNPWQGDIRYAPHISPEYLVKTVSDDLKDRRPERVLLAVTHLNETDGIMRFSGGDIPFDELSLLPSMSAVFDGYLSSYSEQELT